MAHRVDDGIGPGGDGGDGEAGSGTDPPGAEWPDAVPPACHYERAATVMRGRERGATLAH